MTRRRVRVANRRNARLSTGPRTATGKQAAARNSLRHGLSLPVLADPALAKEIVELAERLADGAADPGMRELAVRVAEAQIDVQRVRHARDAVIARPAMGASAAEPRSDALRKAIRELVALDRYERRAMWRQTLARLAWQAALLRNRENAP